MTEELEIKKQIGVLHRLHLCKQYITVEPILLLFMIPFSMSSLAIQNLNLEKACRVNLNLTNSICDALQYRNLSGYNETDEILVQKVVASSYIWKNVVNGVFPAILLPMLGSWSDRNNIRKALMLLPLTAEILTNVGFLLCTYFFYELPMEVSVVIEVFPTALTGGSNMHLLGIFTYIAVASTKDNRTFRIGIVHVLYSVSVTIGYALSGIMYNSIGFYGVFAISLTMYSMGAIYTMYCINEIEDKTAKVQTKLELIKDMANVKKTFNTFKFLFKPHQTNRRTQIFVIIALAILVLGPFLGETTVLYLYTRFMFNWDEIGFSIFYTYYCVVHFIGCMVALSLFTKCLKLDDALLGAISSVSKIIGGLVYMLAKIPVLFYIATLLEVFNGTAFIVSRSILTKLVSREELGKVNSLFGVAEALTALIYGPLYSAIYKAFLHKFSGAFFLVGVILTIPPVVMYLWLYKNRHTREFCSQSEDVITKDPLSVQTNGEVVTSQNYKIDMEKKE